MKGPPRPAPSGRLPSVGLTDPRGVRLGHLAEAPPPPPPSTLPSGGEPVCAAHAEGGGSAPATPGPGICGRVWNPLRWRLVSWLIYSRVRLTSSGTQA